MGKSYCFDGKRSDCNLLLCFRKNLRQLVIERRSPEFNLTLSKSVIQKGQALIVKDFHFYLSLHKLYHGFIFTRQLNKHFQFTLTCTTLDLLNGCVLLLL